MRKNHIKRSFLALMIFYCLVFLLLPSGALAVNKCLGKVDSDNDYCARVPDCIKDSKCRWTRCDAVPPTTQATCDRQNPCEQPVMGDNNRCKWFEQAGVTPPPVSAVEPAVKIESEIEQRAEKELNPLGFSGGPAKLIGAAIGFFMFAMGSIALVLYIWAGFTWMIASGNPEKITSAKRIFVWTTLGVVAMLGSYIIVNFVFKTVLWQ